MDWRDRLETAMHDRGVSQERLAKAIGTHQPQITKWVTNRVGSPKSDQWAKIADTLDVPLDWLLRDGDLPPPGYRTEDEREALDLIRKVGPVEARKAIQDWLVEQHRRSEAGASLPRSRILAARDEIT